jgi:hypothetical protein
MCSGIALAYSDIPLEMVEGLSPLVHERGGEKEFRFLYRMRNPKLPVWVEGRLQIVQWGIPGSGVEPGRGCVWQDAVESVLASAVKVDVPATLGCSNGIWFRITQGVRGALIREELGSVVYLIVEPSSHYYQTMTKCQYMPVLIGERI